MLSRKYEVNYSKLEKKSWGFNWIIIRTYG